MTTMIAVLFLLALIVLAASAYILWLWHYLRARKAQARVEAKSSQLALELHPAYQAKVDADRAFMLQQARLDLERQEFALKRHLALHYVSPETYIVNAEVGQLLALPSLKTQPAAKGIGQMVGSGQQELPQAPRFRDMTHLIGTEMIPLCWTVNGPRMGGFDELLSTGLIGRPKRGKTTALLYYVCLLLMIQADIWVWDLHGSMEVLAGLNYFDSFESILDSIPYLEADLEERDALYHEKPKRYKRPLVLLVDEVPALVGRYEALDRRQKLHIPDPLMTLRPFVLEARKWNGYAFVSGQSLPAEVLPTLTRDNLSSRIVFECSADHARQMGLPKQTIDTLLPRLRGADRGTHIADYSTWSVPELADIPYTTEDDLTWALARAAGRPSSETGRNTDETTSSAVSSPFQTISDEEDVWPKTGIQRVRSETGRNTGDMSQQAVSDAFRAVSSKASPQVNTSCVSQETRDRIERYAEMRVDGELLAWREIAANVHMGGDKYKLFRAVCAELGYDTSKGREEERF